MSRYAPKSPSGWSAFAFGAVITLLMFCTLPARADFNSDARGTTTANFLKLGVGARATAMGEAYSAVADEATAMYWNPGALTRIPEKTGSATVMHAPYVASTFFDYAAFAKNIDGKNAWGTSLNYFSAGAISEVDDNGFENGSSFNPYDLAVAAGYAHRFKDISLGLSAKFIRSQIVASAQTAAVDFGVISRPLWHERLHLAAVASNIGGKMKFESESNRLPMAYRLGSSYQLTKNWLGALDVAFPIDNSPLAAIGSEYRWLLGRNWNIAARAGLNTRTLSDVEGLTGVSFGIGMDFESIILDYALQPLGELGLTHRLSLSFRFLPSFIRSQRSANVMHAPDYPEYHGLPPAFDDENPFLRDNLQ